jgi:hypothetical protein
MNANPYGRARGPGRIDALQRTLVNIAASIPAYQVRIGSQLLSNPEATIADLMERLGRSCVNRCGASSGTAAVGHGEPALRHATVWFFYSLHRKNQARHQETNKHHIYNMTGTKYALACSKMP